MLVPPTIIGFSNKTVIEGAEIAMVCNATGIPPPNITITYEGKSLMEEQWVKINIFGMICFFIHGFIMTTNLLSINSIVLKFKLN